MISSTLILLVCLGSGFSNPFENSEPENVTLEANVLDDGRIMIEDMIMTMEQFQEYYPHVETIKDSGVTVHKRVAVSSRSLWPNGRIPYAWSSSFPGSKSAVLSAMNDWMKATCIKFVPKTAYDRYYVLIQDGLNGRSTCNADLGFQRRRTGIFLHRGCMGKRTLLHELGHTIGLIHEHQHPERDRYLTIHWNNIDPANQRWFKTEGQTWGIPYDIYSVMHYFSTAFLKSNCWGCKSMTSVWGDTYTRLMGTRAQLSTNSDIPIVKKMYNCR